MSWLRVETADGRTGFAPGEEVAGTAAWSLGAAPSSLELRLFWYTEGKGTRDVGVVEQLPCELVPEGRREFRFRLPAGPYSVSGKLVSLLWAVELVAEPSGDVARAEITVGPGGQEVRIGASGPAGSDGAGAG